MARELENFDARNVLAGRMLIEAVEFSISAGRSFAVETTLSSRRYLRIVRSIRAGRTSGNGSWRFGLLYVGLDSADLAVSRVARRVASGGHDIPEIDVRRRFTRSCGLLPEYMESVDRCLVFDNGSEAPHLLLDHRGPGSPHRTSPFPWETRND
jgi:predicted ABC-type ATPase